LMSLHVSVLLASTNPLVHSHGFMVKIV
jgi:hypothetical protein